jgi:T-complex protein 1 subunit gamma
MASPYGAAPIVVMSQNAKRETGSIARENNIAAAKAVSDIIRTTLGPRSMLKMILDASGGA